MRMSFNAALCSRRLACICPFDLDLVDRPRAMTSEWSYSFDLTCPGHFLGTPPVPPMRGERHHWVHPSNTKDGQSYCCKCLCYNTEQRNQFQDEGEYGSGGYDPRPRYFSFRVPLNKLPYQRLQNRANADFQLYYMREKGFPKRAIRIARFLLVEKRDDYGKRNSKEIARFENWTAHKRNKFLKEFGATLPPIVALLARRIPTVKRWRRYRIEGHQRNPKKVLRAYPRKYRGKLKTLIAEIKALDPAVWRRGWNMKRRHELAFEYGRFLTRKQLERLLDCPKHPRSKKN